jgi:DNA-binding NarL/FixJ family response regulator
LETSTFRVLVVDDYEPWRAVVAAILKNQSKLRIIGEARDGFEAVQIAQQLQPDLILLDIGLPALNGIEAARRIREVSPKSKILFVSDNRSWDIAEEGLRIGAIGYVVKSDAGAELLPALKAALEGRRLLSASLVGRDAVDASNESKPDNFRLQQTAAQTPVERDGRPHSHDAVFYSDDRMLLDNVTRFIGAALRAGSSAIVVATESHRESFLSSLEAYGVDLGAAIEQGRYIAVDAADTISTFVVDSMLDTARFMDGFGNLIQRARKAAKTSHARVAIFGEGAHILWKRGNARAAIQDEKLCNRLIEMYDVDMLCGYSLVGVDEGIDSNVVQHIREQHSVARIF